MYLKVDCYEANSAIIRHHVGALLGKPAFEQFFAQLDRGFFVLPLAVRDLLWRDVRIAVGRGYRDPHELAALVNRGVASAESLREQGIIAAILSAAGVEA